MILRIRKAIIYQGTFRVMSRVMPRIKESDEVSIFDYYFKYKLLAISVLKYETLKYETN